MTLADEMLRVHDDVRVHDQLLRQVYQDMVPRLVLSTWSAQRVRDSYCALREKVSVLAEKVVKLEKRALEAENEIEMLEDFYDGGP